MEYSTGELAKMCDVSVRTVQYYDQKGLLRPSRVEHQRRIYSEADKTQLESIVLLKSMGVSLQEIHHILNEAEDTATLKVLLKKKETELQHALAQTKQQLDRLQKLDELVGGSDSSILDNAQQFEAISERMDQMSKIRRNMLIAGIAVGGYQVSTLVRALTQKDWKIWARAIPFRMLFAAGFTAYYYQKVSYVCPNCQTVFKPKLSHMIFANHTFKTRRLTCPHCGETHYCIEIAAQ
ncbi:MerR family transcriptional regulator [Staphylococcus simulans]|uniref:MerR family transcriptional regulator n=1 Tax=Staphylococcus simulans TaxID=1286 RepID=UPI001E640C7A|nr:MerR family transcriptional regulator [Staphylococcus simulans]MCD8915943.1 MerR family transcriptional regulator [Staphylococcus simulans]